MRATRTEPAPVDTTLVRATVDSIYTMLDGPCSRYEELVESENLLRRHINLLLEQPAASENTFVLGVRAHLREGMGEGLISARSHVRQLARDCGALLPLVERAAVAS